MAFEPPLSIGSPRAEDRQRYSLSQPADEMQGKDTLLLVSAVCFPDSYDWQRDSAFGNVSCTIKLYEGTDEVLSLQAGPGTCVSAAPDGHHIIDGELYTVFTDRRGTYIGCGGACIAHWTERERVCGLVSGDGGLYSLGVPAGGGLVYRCNGTEILRRNGGMPFGCFGAQSYDPTGALYTDSGSVCFAFLDDGAVYFVRDGEYREPVSRAGWKVLDAKIIDGREAVLYNYSNNSFIRVGEESFNYTERRSILWRDAAIVSCDGGIGAAGVCEEWTRRRICTGVCVGNRFTEISGEPEFLYFDSGSCIPLCLSELGLQDCIFFGGSCAFPLDGALALALTPKDTLRRPFTLFRGERREYPLHGFISGISIKLPE